MHYRNGRPAQAGDKIVNLVSGESGVLYDPNSQATSCNGRLAKITGSDSYITLSECVHIDDVKALTSPKQPS